MVKVFKGDARTPLDQAWPSSLLVVLDGEGAHCHDGESVSGKDALSAESPLPVKTGQEKERTHKCLEYGERQFEKRHRQACSLADWRQVSGSSLASSLFLFLSWGSVSICRRLSRQATRRNGRTLSGLRVHARREYCLRAVCWATLSLKNACHPVSGRDKRAKEGKR